MLKILIVEDDSQLATTLKYLVEDNPRYRVVAIADDADSAIAAAETHDPDIALLDLHLARGSTGFSVAVKLADLNVPCLFVSGKAPSFPMPDLALGCLMKPFTAEDVHRSLAMAEDMLRGRETLRPKLPRQSHFVRAGRRPVRRAAVRRARASSRRARRSRPGSSIGSPATRPDGYSRILPRRGSRVPKRFFGQRRAGVEQRLAPALDVGAALDVLERQQLREHRLLERCGDEAGDPRPALCSRP